MRRLFSFFLFAILLGNYAMAYDFSAVCESGQTLYYNITSSTEPYTVEVTIQNTLGISPYYSTYPIGNLEIPESVEYDNITYSVTSIGESAFRECNGLTSVTIPNSVTSIGERAFDGCSGLTSVTIGNSVTDIGNYAFAHCIGLTEITIPNSVTSIGISAFEQCTGLTTVNYNAINCTTMGNNSAYAFKDCNATATINIGSNVTIIPDYAFEGLLGNGALEIPNSVTSIGYMAFCNCSGLTSVTIGNSVTSIGVDAFSGCSGLTSPVYNASIFAYFPNGYATDYTIPDGIQQIACCAFNNCSGLTSVTIPNSVTSIGYEAFCDCSGLTSVTIGNSVISIGKEAFMGCSNLTSVTIPNSVTSIGDAAFSYCSGLSTVNFNATNCTTMVSSSYPVFYNCTSLSILNIGENVTRIPDGAFGYCALDSIISAASNPPLIYANTFDFNPLSNIPVVVPCGTVETYNNADFWYNFRRIQQDASCPAQYTITVLSCNPNYGVVTGGGEYLENTTAILTATPYEECMFVNWNDGNTDNPREITVTEDATYIATFVRGTYNPTIYNAIADTACGSYTWNGDIYTESGEYEQTFTAANSVDSVVTLTLTILPLPVPEITVDGILDACNPETTSVTLHTGEYDSYIWSNAATGESAIVTTPGEYSVEVVDSMGCHGFSEGVTVGYSTILNEAPYITNAGMTNNGKNLLQWQIADTTGVRGFNIYREDAEANMFTFIKQVMRLKRSTIDSTADPNVRAYRYKVCAVDECGGMSPVSTPHRTMHLTINQGVGNAWNLIWSPYEGMPIRSYRIYRGTTVQNMVVIGEVPGDQNSYTDNGNPYNAGFFYKVVIVKNTRSNDEEDEDIMLSSNIVDNGYIVTHNVIVASSNPAYGSASGSGVYADGTEVVIEAAANAGYEFTAWNDGSTENPRSVTITSDTLFIANFVELQQTPTFTITVYSSNQAYGTVSGGGTYEEGTEIQLVATANEGYEFVSWSDGSDENPHTITVTEDAMYIATFIAAQPVVTHTITVISANPSQGVVTGGGTYPEGTEISIEAIAAEGYEFLSWSDNNNENPRQIIVTEDAMYVASFVPTTDIEENIATEINLFPNPATNILNITSSETISEIEIVNVMGQVVKRFDVNADKAVCDVEDLTGGVYVVRIQTEGMVVFQRKFVKE